MSITAQKKLEALLSPSRSDGELLAQKAIPGSPDPFAELVRRHAPMVLALCRRKLGDSHDAEDAAQAVFLVLWQKADALRQRASVAGWLHQVATNICRNANRARQIRATHERRAGSVSDRSSRDRSSRDQSSSIREILDDALNALPEKYRVPIVLFHLESRSLVETAQLLQMNPSTLTTRLSRGRQLLRDRLVREGVAVTTATMGGLLAEHAAASGLPLFFAETTALAVVQAKVSEKVFALAKGAGTMWTMRKTVVMAVIALAMMLGGGVVFWPRAVNDQTWAISKNVNKVAEPGQQAQSKLAASEGKNNGKEMPVIRVLSESLQANYCKDMAIIGRAPKLDDKELEEFRKSGKIKMMPAKEREELAVALASPMPALRFDEFWEPTRVFYNGKRAFTLVIESWRVADFRNFSPEHQSVRVISLGKWKAGSYSLTIRVRDLYIDWLASKMKKSPEFYGEHGWREITVEFVVAETDTPDEAGNVTIIRANRLSESQGNGKFYQNPFGPVFPGPLGTPKVHYFKFDGMKDDLPKPGYTVVGSCDPADLMKSPTIMQNRETFPWSPPEEGKPVYVRVEGPILVNGRMNLREIEWKGRRVILRVDLWQDNFKKPTDFIRLPILVVPLSPAGFADGPGQYEVQVEWNLLYDKDGKLYTRYKSPDEIKTDIPFKKEFALLATKTNSPKFTLVPKGYSLPTIPALIHFRKFLGEQPPKGRILRIAGQQEAEKWFDLATIGRLKGLVDFTREDILVVSDYKSPGRYVKHWVEVNKDKTATVHFRMFAPPEQQTDAMRVSFYTIPRDGKVKLHLPEDDESP
jgi:RNA polymerase sigma factor (sigma-70 family)